VDIKLGGNPEHMTQLELAKLGLRPGDPDYDERFAEILPRIEARVESDFELVREAGGLFICGTERHESRRIDNQLRGRAGRQGDPGESRFFLSGQDDLVRLFAGDRIYKILDRLGPKTDEGEEEPIESKILTKQIESAQRKVEEQNYLIRKRVLEYDDVMNQQREVVYQYRDEVLEGRDMGYVAREQVEAVIGRTVDEFTPGDFADEWDFDGLWGQLDQIYQVDFGPEEIDRGTDREELKRLLVEDALSLYDEREQELGEELMRALERYLILQIIDQRWREHLYDMDYLREGIHLRGFAQIEPLVAYKNEAFTLFEDLMNSIWSDFARMIFHVEVEVQASNGDGQPVEAPWEPPPPPQAGGLGALAYSGGTPDDQPSAYGAPGEPPGQEPQLVQQRRVDEHEQIGRNDPCWCGSGKKFKKCHGA
jgi:preprotein translocase subunit SecA